MVAEKNNYQKKYTDKWSKKLDKQRRLGEKVSWSIKIYVKKKLSIEPCDHLRLGIKSHTKNLFRAMLVIASDSLKAKNSKMEGYSK